MRVSGLRLESPTWTSVLSLPVVSALSEIEWRPDDVVVIATKSQDTLAALHALVAAANVELPDRLCAERGRERTHRPSSLPKRLRDSRHAPRHSHRSGHGAGPLVTDQRLARHRSVAGGKRQPRRGDRGSLLVKSSFDSVACQDIAALEVREAPDESRERSRCAMWSPLGAGSRGCSVGAGGRGGVLGKGRDSFCRQG